MNSSSGKNKIKTFLNEEKFEKTEQSHTTSSARVNTNQSLLDSLDDKKLCPLDFKDYANSQNVSVKLGDGIFYLENENCVIFKKYLKELRPFYDEKVIFL
jgi:hypothetical protein